jgi:UDP-GlcNAc:undecaprenyl-phosphate GlcNAc-1-phosphate transferase
MFWVYFISCLLTLVSLFLYVKIARKYQLFLDLPKENRKVHRKVAFRVGGLSILSSLIVVSSLYKNIIFIELFIAFLPLFIISIYEDLKETHYKLRFISQTFSSILGLSLFKTYIANIGVQISPIFGIPLSIFAIVGGTNAFNLIDGINGLASSLALLTFLIYGSVFYSQNLNNFGDLSFLIASSLAAFIPVNLISGKIFLGDTGSYFLGFSLSLLAIILAGGIYTDISPWFAVVTLFYPLWETIFSYIRRKLKGKNPFTPDREHMHHLLLKLFKESHLKTTLTIVGFQAILDILAINFAKDTPILIGIFLISTLIYLIGYRVLYSKVL